MNKLNAKQAFHFIMNNYNTFTHRIYLIFYSTNQTRYNRRNHVHGFRKTNI